MDEKQFLETWEIHNRINLYLLDAVEPARACQFVGFERSDGGRAVCTHSQRATDVAEVGGA